jgi:Cu(I)/Ag(I) efflux system membrane protein CusA/SilA
MLVTGIKSPVGIGGRRFEPRRDRSYLARQTEQVVRTVPGVASALAERLTGGRYIDVTVDRASARYGLNVADVQSVVSGAIGGETVGQTVEGLARYPIQVRYPREIRDSPDKLASLPVLTPAGQQITLGSVVRIDISEGPPMLRSENGRPVTWIYVDGRGSDMQTMVGDIQRVITAKVKPPPASAFPILVSTSFLANRAKERMKLVILVTLAIILGLCTDFPALG